MKVSEIMTARVVAAKANASCTSLAQKMLSGFVSGLPVIDDQGHVIGVVTEFDILKVLRNGENGLAAVAKDIMTKEPICLEANQTVDEAIELMTRHHIIRIPVTSAGKLVGIVSRTDVLGAYVKEEFQVFEATPEFEG
ncbi:MAG TPA: CBS domain-containing protein [Candidatus Aquilonibacter sp.]|nr:CBS domain-containing protein [Candidatus Aquilonibacter sp.]